MRQREAICAPLTLLLHFPLSQNYEFIRNYWFTGGLLVAGRKGLTLTLPTTPHLCAFSSSSSRQWTTEDQQRLQAEIQQKQSVF